MTEVGLSQIIFFFLCVLLLVKPLGWYMARVYENQSCGLEKVVGPVERFIYRICQINTKQDMNWKQYLISMLILNLFGLLIVYFLQRIQYYLPFNPQQFSGASPDLSFNTAVSFATNTNWQSYSGETTMSYFTQMLGLTMQNFLSAATGMVIVIAFIRGISQQQNESLGNFWVDITRTTLYILLPLSFIFALFLTSQGVIQNFKANQSVTLIQPFTYQNDTHETIKQDHQIIPMGPVASQIAIKQLGSNGGGFFNVNAAHPFENPTPLSNFFETLAILLIPASLCYTYGTMVRDKREGYAILAAMYLVIIPFTFIAVAAEQHGNPGLSHLGVDQAKHVHLSSGGNMEGKEVRFGIVHSALWATATTATSNGSVNAMIDSFTPIGSAVPLWMMHLGEIIFGGVGSGLYGMLMLIIIAVFVAGLMVGRTPEYLGKKIEPYEIKMASFAVLVMPLVVLILTAIASVLPAGYSSTGNPAPHGFSEILYAFTSMGNNNGSSLAGLSANTPFYNILGGICMLITRYWLIIPTLAIAGSLARKKRIPSTLGTLQTYTPLFIFLLVSIIIILGALSFLPALALGPIVEQINLWGQYGG